MVLARFLLQILTIGWLHMKTDMNCEMMWILLCSRAPLQGLLRNVSGSDACLCMRFVLGLRKLRTVVLHNELF